MSLLFTPLRVRDITFRNRIVAGPMCMYSAHDGVADDYHLVHLGRFALGCFGAVMTEAVSVTPQGRISHGCLGLWSDSQIEPLARIARFLRQQGAVPGIQLSHAGRKASSRRPWRGEGSVIPLDEAELGDAPWATVAPSPLAQSVAYQTPMELDESGMRTVASAFRAATHRAIAAGFEVIELHMAHGYLLHQFLSPIANRRADQFGGKRDNRMRWPLMIAKEMRQIWPNSLPMFVRISATDNIPGGWDMTDSLVLSAELKRIGVDVIVCSSGGFAGASRNAFTDNHLPYSWRIRTETEVRTMAVGLITQPGQAEAALQEGYADLVGISRQALFEPNWPHHAALEMDGRADWPNQMGWVLAER